MLPGIGEVLAQRIVSYRNDCGAFQTCEDLMLVSGIGVKLFLRQERDELQRMQKEQQLAFAREEDQKRLEHTLKKMADKSASEDTDEKNE